jgi:outer membrane lipoprotein SlyB
VYENRTHLSGHHICKVEFGLCEVYLLFNQKEGRHMKRSIILFVIATMMSAVFIFTPTTSLAQSTYYRRVVRNGRVTWVRTAKPSYYRRHRNRVNMAVGTGAGALVGGLVGGGKGAAIGAGTGLAGSALYTYKLNKKKRVYRKVRRY